MHPASSTSCPPDAGFSLAGSRRLRALRQAAFFSLLPGLSQAHTETSALTAPSTAEPSASPWAQIYLQADEGQQLLVGLMLMLILPALVLGVSVLKRWLRQVRRDSRPG